MCHVVSSLGFVFRFHFISFNRISHFCHQNQQQQQNHPHHCLFLWYLMQKHLYTSNGNTIHLIVSMCWQFFEWSFSKSVRFWRAMDTEPKQFSIMRSSNIVLDVFFFFVCVVVCIMRFIWPTRERTEMHAVQKSTRKTYEQKHYKQ